MTDLMILDGEEVGIRDEMVTPPPHWIPDSAWHELRRVEEG